MATRTRMSAPERRAQLLDVAKELVGELGFHDVSLEAVARRAGITRPIVYDHFPGGLGELLSAMIEREGARALTQLEALVPRGGEPGSGPEVLLGAMTAYLGAVTADPVTWRLVLMPPEGAPELLRRLITQGRTAIAAALAGAVGTELLGDGPSPDPELTAGMLQALAEEGARLVLTDPQAHPPERILAHTRWLLERLSR